MKPFSKFSKILLPVAATTLNLFAQSDPVTLPTLVVTADADYKASNASTATKTDIPVKDIPASIQVVPVELLEDRGVTQVRQMLENVSGIQAESSYGGNGATFFNIRGFTTSNAMRDGFRNYGYIATRDVQNIERIDVLKGPAGAIYGGSGSLGGYINTVSKRPQDTEFGEASITAGSYGFSGQRWIITLNWAMTLAFD